MYHSKTYFALPKRKQILFENRLVLGYADDLGYQSYQLIAVNFMLKKLNFCEVGLKQAVNISWHISERNKDNKIDPTKVLFIEVPIPLCPDIRVFFCFFWCGGWGQNL